MTDLRDAARQALEAWQDQQGMKLLCEAMDALGAALEQPKPVFYAPRRLSNEEVMAVIGPFRRETEQEAHIKELEQARERDNIAFKQLLAQRDALLEAQNGKKVRNHEGGTRYQPPVEDAAITSLRAALEQPEQEPVAWRFQSPLSEEGQWEYGKEPPVGSRWAIEPLFTHPPRREWRSLSDEELDRLWREPMSADWEHREFARAIEAALRSKNHE
jgi:hypothetical protein